MSADRIYDNIGQDDELLLIYLEDRRNCDTKIGIDGCVCTVLGKL